MRIEDMILISVDDHVVEPPDMFERHIPDRGRGILENCIVGARFPIG